MIQTETMPERTHPFRTVVTRAEVELLLCCARTRTSPEMSQRIREAAQKQIDWVQLYRLAFRHGTLPLLYWNLHRICPNIVPGGVLEPLRLCYEAIAAEGQRLAEELVGILGLLESHNIPVVPYKGPALAVRLYDDLSRRGVGDLDIVIREPDVLRVQHLLIERGYAPGRIINVGLDQYTRDEFEMPFVRLDGKVRLDLHWRFTNRLLCLARDPERFLQQLEPLSIVGKEVQSMRLETYMLILSMHGAKHKWGQLKLVCDIAEILAVSDLDWHYVLHEADDMGIKRALRTGLLLAQSLLEAPVPPIIAGELKIDPTAKALAAQACARLFEDPGEGWGPEPGFTAQLELRERFRDRAKIFLRYLLPKLKPNERDRWFLPMPRSLSRAYYFVRPVRLALERMRRTRHS